MMGVVKTILMPLVAGLIIVLAAILAVWAVILRKPLSSHHRNFGLKPRDSKSTKK